MTFKAKKNIVTLGIFFFSSLLSTAYAESLCGNLEGGLSCNPSKTVSLIDTKQNFDKYFSIIQGDHVGTHENQKYMSEQVSYENGSIKINTVPLSSAIECLSNGNFGPEEVIYPGTCTYKSGAIYTRGKFEVNKTIQNGLEEDINKGAIEIKATIAQNGNRTLSGGLWPAIWMMSNKLDDTFIHDGKTWERNSLWPSAMEIDILEYMQGSSDVVGTLHYGLYTGKNTPPTSWNYTNNKDLVKVGDWQYSIGDDVYLPKSNPQEVHTFGFMWDLGTEKQMIGRTITLTWFYDGKPYFRYTFSRSASTQSYSKMKFVRNAANTEWKAVKDDACIQAAEVTNRCPSLYLNDSETPDKLAEAMFRSFDRGFEAGYYLILNSAVGGDGVVKGNLPIAKDIVDTMTIYSIKRYSIDDGAS